MIYLYPDLKTTIVGKSHSEKHTLIKGKEAFACLSFHKSLNKDHESVLVLRLESCQPKFSIGCKHPSSSSIIENGAIDLILIEIHKDIFATNESFVRFVAPNSKCIR